MVSAIQSVPIISFPTIMRIQESSGKIRYPVKPLGSISAVFKHIDAIPSKQGVGGISLYKLRILDGLIEKLIRTGKYSNTRNIAVGRIDKESIDNVIEKLSLQLKASVNSLASYSSGIGIESGLIVNLLA